MKIAYLFNSSIPSNNASSLQVVKMCGALSELGHKVLLITPNTGIKNKSIKSFYGSKKDFKRIKMNYFNKFPLGINYYLFSLFSILKVLDKKIDLFLTRNFFTCFLLVLFGKKTVIEVHHDLNIESRIVRLIFKFLNILNSKSIIKIIAITKNVKKMLINSYHVQPNKIEILPSSSDIKIKYNQLNKFNKNFFKIGYFGSLDKTKGVEFIIELSKYDNKNKYYVFGDKIEKVNQLKKTYSHKNLDINPYIQPSKLKDYLNKMDICLMPYNRKLIKSSGGVGNISKYTSPLKLFDYMACGKIILSSKVNVLLDILKHNYNSILIDRLDIKVWKKEIDKLLKNKKKCQKISKNVLLISKQNTYYNRAKKLLIGI